eukprot:962558_1
MFNAYDSFFQIDTDSSSESECSECEDRINKSNTYNNNHKHMITILDLVVNKENKCIINEESNQIVVNITEEMANEELGSDECFGMVGDIKKIQIIRKKSSRNIKAKITFHSSQSTVEISKLVSVYQTLTHFSNN